MQGSEGKGIGDMEDSNQIQIITAIRAILAEVLDIDEGEITEDASIIHDLEADSTDFVEISAQLEERLGQFFPLVDWYDEEKYRENPAFSVRSLADFIAVRLRKE
jgi:acyl carrier protein